MSIDETPALDPPVTRNVTRGFDAEALKRARENHPDENLRRRGEVARLAGIGRSTLAQWETGKKTPQVDLLAKVARTLGVSMEQLVPIPRDQRYLRDWRVHRGMLQPDLARLAGMSTPTLSRIELGETALTDDKAERLAHALELPITEVRAAYLRARNRPPGAAI